MNRELILEECKALSRQLDMMASDLEAEMREKTDAKPILEILDELAYLSDRLDDLVEYTGKRH